MSFLGFFQTFYVFCVFHELFVLFTFLYDFLFFLVTVFSPLEIKMSHHKLAVGAHQRAPVPGAR